MEPWGAWPSFSIPTIQLKNSPLPPSWRQSYLFIELWFTRMKPSQLSFPTEPGCGVTSRCSPYISLLCPLCPQPKIDTDGRTLHPPMLPFTSQLHKPRCPTSNPTIVGWTALGRISCHYTTVRLGKRDEPTARLKHIKTLCPLSQNEKRRPGLSCWGEGCCEMRSLAEYRESVIWHPMSIGFLVIDLAGLIHPLYEMKNVVMKRSISRSLRMYYSFNMTEWTVTECNSNISKSNQ